MDVFNTWDDAELALAEGALESERIPYGVRRTHDDGIRYWICVDVADYDRAAEVLGTLGREDDEY